MKEIQLTQGQVTKVSDEDYEELTKYKWQAKYCKDTDSYYAFRNVFDSSVKCNYRTIRMHTTIA